eukprot:1205904-Amphidinium_carterae.1
MTAALGRHPDEALLSSNFVQAAHTCTQQIVARPTATKTKSFTNSFPLLAKMATAAALFSLGG